MTSPAKSRQPGPRRAADPVLSFRHVGKTYDTFAAGTKHALNGVSFDVQRGQRIAIVGRSGSGKSTLLHLAAGIDVPSAGTISWSGRDMSALTERERTRVRRDNIGLVFQFFHLLSHLSVAENVCLPELIAGRRAASVGSRVMQLLQRVGLADRANDAVDQLSGGEMQRVAICRALIRRPSLVLADEPTGNLDDTTGRAVMDLMFEMVEETGSTLLFVTHSQELAARADDIWTLHSGTLERS